jgi:hypothetical protein
MTAIIVGTDLFPIQCGIQSLLGERQLPYRMGFPRSFVDPKAAFRDRTQDPRLKTLIDRLCDPMPDRAGCLDKNVHDPGERHQPTWRPW